MAASDTEYSSMSHTAQRAAGQEGELAYVLLLELFNSIRTFINLSQLLKHGSQLMSRKPQRGIVG